MLNKAIYIGYIYLFLMYFWIVLERPWVFVNIIYFICPIERFGFFSFLPFHDGFLKIFLPLSYMFSLFAYFTICLIHCFSHLHPHNKTIATLANLAIFHLKEKTPFSSLFSMRHCLQLSCWLSGPQQWQRHQHQAAASSPQPRREQG